MKTVLIVDPECSGEKLAAILDRCGCTALVVGSGRKALDIIRKGASVDMVIMEIHLPDMGGSISSRRSGAHGQAFRSWS